MSAMMLWDMSLFWMVWLSMDCRMVCVSCWVCGESLVLVRVVSIWWMCVGVSCGSFILFRCGSMCWLRM